MNFIVSANTDVGTTKSTNQDSLAVMTMNTPQGRMAFAVLCDGMGGLAKGEVASAAVIHAFREWAYTRLPELSCRPLEDAVIRGEWETIVRQQNQKIQAYGKSCGIRLGTTVVAMLITANRYYVMNVGDSRAYELMYGLRQITEDQTLVAREVAMGHITPQQAELHPQRNVLLQCVGASDQVYPDMYFGDTQVNAVYMLCSDGFRHEITADEIFAQLQPGVLFDDQTMQRNSVNLIELNKQRQERDNISVALVRTF